MNNIPSSPKTDRTAQASPKKTISMSPRRISVEQPNRSQERVKATQRNLFAEFDSEDEPANQSGEIVTRKRANDGDISTQYLKIARRDNQRDVQVVKKVEPRVDLEGTTWIPNDVWFNILSLLSLKDCVNFEGVSREFNKIFLSYTFNKSWKDRLGVNQSNYILRGETDKSICVGDLIKRTIRCEEDIRALGEVRNNAWFRLHKCVQSYGDVKGALLGIILGHKFGQVAQLFKSRYLDNLKNICSGIVDGVDYDYAYIHARKIISYYLVDERSTAIHEKSIRVLFSGIEYALCNGSNDEFNEWLKLVCNAFDQIESYEQNTWFYRCINLLGIKGVDGTDADNVVSLKKLVFNLIKEKLPVYLEDGRYWALSELMKTLKLVNVDVAIKKEVEEVLKCVCVEYSTRIIKVIAENYSSFRKSKNGLDALNRIIISAIQMDKENFVVLLNSITDVLKSNDSDYIKNLLLIPADVYNQNDDDLKMDIRKMIVGYLSDNYLSIDHDLSRELSAILRS